MKDVTLLTQMAGNFIHSIAGHLSHSSFSRVPGNAGNSYPPRFEMKEEQDIIRHETTPC
jgi:hypothetical protein